jgi:hypothetical protein
MPVRTPTMTSINAPHIAKTARLNQRMQPALESTQRWDQREYSRRALHCDVWLIDAESQCVLRCKTDDVSDAGLHVTAPIGFGLGVGRRFEARIATPQQTTGHGGGSHLGDSLGYATVIRTEIKVDEQRTDRVSCALQFDVPQVVPV